MVARIFLLILLTWNTALWANQKVFQTNLGLSWPRDRDNQAQTPFSLDLTLRLGHRFDNILTAGTQLTVGMNRSVQEQLDTLSGKQFTAQASYSYLIPLSVYLSFTPLSKADFSPQLWAAVGYASHLYRQSGRDVPQEQTKRNGYYFGLNTEAGIDASYKLSRTTALIGGISYRWANTRTWGETFYRRDMSGPALSAGIQLWL